MTLTFTIPSPPSTNSLWANVAGKGRVRTERYRVWRQAAGWALKIEDGKSRPFDTITGRVAVEIVLGNHRQDIDNIKAVLDLLQDAAVIGNDSQVDDLHVVRSSRPSREAIVIVRPLEAQAKAGRS